MRAAHGRLRRGTGRGPAQPVVDRLHLASTKAWRQASARAPRHAHEIRALRESLRESHYDAVLDLQGAVRSAVVARMAGCRRRIGESQPREWAARWLFTERVATRGAHVIEQDVELASAVAGDDLDPVQPWLPVDPAAEAWCDEIARTLSRTGPRCSSIPAPDGAPSAGRSSAMRRLPTALAERGFRVLVNAGPGEESLAEAIVAQSGGAAMPLNCSLAQLIALTRRVALVIAGDTGPLHLACALGRPVVGIYGPTDPSRNGPFGTRFRVLRSPDSRRDHSRRREPEAGSADHQPEDVLQAADELLAGRDP